MLSILKLKQYLFEYRELKRLELYVTDDLPHPLLWPESVKQRPITERRLYEEAEGDHRLIASVIWEHARKLTPDLVQMEPVFKFLKDQHNIAPISTAFHGWQSQVAAHLGLMLGLLDESRIGEDPPVATGTSIDCIPELVSYLGEEHTQSNFLHCYTAFHMVREGSI